MSRPRRSCTVESQHRFSEYVSNDEYCRPLPPLPRLPLVSVYLPILPSPAKISEESVHLPSAAPKFKGSSSSRVISGFSARRVDLSRAPGNVSRWGEHHGQWPVKYFGFDGYFQVPRELIHLPSELRRNRDYVSVTLREKLITSPGIRNHLPYQVKHHEHGYSTDESIGLSACSWKQQTFR